MESLQVLLVIRVSFFYFYWLHMEHLVKKPVPSAWASNSLFPQTNTLSKWGMPRFQEWVSYMCWEQSGRVGIYQACSPLLNQIVLILSHTPAVSFHTHTRTDTHTDAFSFLKLVFTLSAYSPSFLTLSHSNPRYCSSGRQRSCLPNSAISRFSCKETELLWAENSLPPANLCVTCSLRRCQLRRACHKLEPSLYSLAVWPWA